MKPRTMPPTLNEIIAAIRERDAGSPRRLCDPIRWDTALANEVERLRAQLWPSATRVSWSDPAK
jgi:hypothetical protein